MVTKEPFFLDERFSRFFARDASLDHTNCGQVGSGEVVIAAGVLCDSGERSYRVQEEMQHRHERYVEHESCDPCQRGICFSARAQIIAHGAVEFRAERSRTLLIIQIFPDRLRVVEYRLMGGARGVSYKRVTQTRQTSCKRTVKPNMLICARQSCTKLRKFGSSALLSNEPIVDPDRSSGIVVNRNTSANTTISQV